MYYMAKCRAINYKWWNFQVTIIFGEYVLKFSTYGFILIKTRVETALKFHFSLFKVYPITKLITKTSMYITKFIKQRNFQFSVISLQSY